MLTKILKVVSVISFIVFIGVYFLFVIYTAPKSDKKVLKLFSNSFIQPKLTHEKFKHFSYRKISFVKDSTLPTFVFIHGTIGSLVSFSEYLNDSLLQSRTNMIAYDRIGYNYKDPSNTQESIAFERDLLKELTKSIENSKLIIVGYSYGGPIALAFKEKIKKIILLAPAVYSKEEIFPWALSFYKWKRTRWLVPDIWKEASKEKISHQKDLMKFETSWQETVNEVISIHGDADGIVPYNNSLILKDAFLKDKFKLIKIKGAGHNLIRSNYETIKQQLITVLDCI